MLFPELFPFGGSLDERNHWLRIGELIPWEELEVEYGKYFSEAGRPAKDAQLVLGLLLLKHMTKLSDREVVAEVLENPYMQAFCGFHSLVTEETLDPSTLARVRKRLGPKFFKELEKKTYGVLIERGIIRARGQVLERARNVSKAIRVRYRVAKEIFRQQWEMYKIKANRIANRIVSLYRPYVRPVKTGKQAKETEFGAKGALVHVDGFLFMDHWKHEAFNEAEYAVDHVAGYVERFGKLPPAFVADTKYGTRANRADLEELRVRPSFKPLGRKAKDQARDPWYRKKQKERNWIEGALGNGKEHYGLGRVRYKSEEMSEVWVRASILAMNLKTALRRA
jgi:hypothetical protein